MHAHGPAPLGQRDGGNEAAEAGADDLRMAGLHREASDFHGAMVTPGRKKEKRPPAGSCRRPRLPPCVRAIRTAGELLELTQPGRMQLTENRPGPLTDELYKLTQLQNGSSTSSTCW